MNALYNASIKHDNSIRFTSSALPETINSKTGVSVKYAPAEDKTWYVLRIKYGQAQAVADAIIEDGIIGRVARVARQNRGVVYLKGLESCITTAYIPPYYLEQVEM